MSDLPFPKDARFLTVREVSALLRVSTKTVRRWIKRGDLRAICPGRDWRIAREDLRAFALARDNQVVAHVL